MIHLMQIVFVYRFNAWFTIDLAQFTHGRRIFRPFSI